MIERLMYCIAAILVAFLLGSLAVSQTNTIDDQTALPFPATGDFLLIWDIDETAGSRTKKSTLSNVSRGLNAGLIPNTPAGTVAATDVQAAIDEVAAESASPSGAGFGEIQYNSGGALSSESSFNYDAQFDRLAIDDSLQLLNTCMDNLNDRMFGDKDCDGNFDKYGERYFDSVGYDLFTNTTNNASPETFPSTDFPVTTDRVHYYEVMVVARRTGGAAGATNDAAAYKFIGLFVNDSGTTTLLGSVNKTVIFEDQAAWDADLVAASPYVRVQVTGALDNNIDWTAGIAVVEQ